MLARRTITLQRVMSQWAGSTRAFSGFVRAGLILAGQHWVKNYLPLHFGPQASRRYNYRPRKLNYLIRKARLHGEYSRAAGLARLAGARDRRTLELLDTRPFEYRGTLKSTALSSANLRAVATKDKAQLTITVPLGHAIPAKHSGQMTAIIQSEERVMRKIAVEHVQFLMRGRLPGVRTERIAA